MLIFMISNFFSIFFLWLKGILFSISLQMSFSQHNLKTKMLSLNLWRSLVRVGDGSLVLFFILRPSPQIEHIPQCSLHGRISIS